MAGTEFSEITEALIYADRFSLLDDPVGRAARRAVEHHVIDALVYEEIVGRVHRHKVAQAFAGSIPLPKLNRGDLVVGFDVNGKTVRMPLKSLNGHSLTVGGSGSGKTNRSYFSIFQVAPLICGLWLFDFRKQEFAILRPLLARLGVKVSIVRGRRMRINPLQLPRGVDPADWAARVSDMLVMIFALPPRATKLLQVSILDLYQEFGVFDGSDRFPILAELREKVSTSDDANPQAKHAVLDALEPVLKSIGDALQYRTGWSTADLAAQKIVFEFGGIAESDKNLLLNTLLVSEFSRRIALGSSNAPMDLWICCDEAARLVGGNGSGAVADSIGLIRGTGIGLDLSVQSSDVSPAVLSNTANKFIGRCGSATDYDVIGNAMGLSSEQRRSIALKLTPGHFVGQIGEGNWRHPFLFRVPHVNLQRFREGFRANSGIADQEGDRSEEMADLLALPTTLVSSSDNKTTAPPCDNQSGSRMGAASSAVRTDSGSNLNEAEVRFLRAVLQNPGQPSSAYSRLAGIGPRRAQAIRKQLVDRGFLKEHLVQTGGRGRTSIVLEPLDPAAEIFSAKAVTTIGERP